MIVCFFPYHPSLNSIKHHQKEPTIGAAFLTQAVLLDDATVKFEIWDTAGQERYRSLAPMYYRYDKIHGCVYDVLLYICVIYKWLTHIPHHPFMLHSPI